LKPGIRRIDTDEDNRVAILLKECELCSADANHLEEMIWTTAGILITASVAGVGFLGSSVPKSLYDYLIRTSIAILSIFFIYLWTVIVSRWYSIQRMMYFRIQEIEEELGMYKERYIIYLDNHIKKNTAPQNLQIGTMLATMRTGYKGPSVRKSVNRIRWLLTFSWLVLLALQLIAMLHLI
jgi:hypothetical protein